MQQWHVWLSYVYQQHALSGLQVQYFSSTRLTYALLARATAAPDHKRGEALFNQYAQSIK